MNLFRQKARAGFTLVEMMTSVACGSLILAALMASSVALQRSFAAVAGYSTTEGNQLRVLDYIAMDCRRALSASVANNMLTLTVAAYYQPDGTAYAPAFNSATNAVEYNGGATYTIQYSQSGSNFVRTVGPTATWPTGNTATAIATNVSSFTVSPLDLASTVSCGITFSPSFTSSLGAGPIAGTTVYSNTFLRNAGARQ
jgi:prepilin-type N-terminal cleavage/methylation domain-containing protein